MQFTDLDWREIMNDFSDADLIYLKSIIDEKLRSGPSAYRFLSKYIARSVPII